MLTRSIAIVYDDPNLLNLYSKALKMSGYDNFSYILIRIKDRNKSIFDFLSIFFLFLYHTFSDLLQLIISRVMVIGKTKSGY